MDPGALKNSLGTVSIWVPGFELYNAITTIGMDRIVPYLSISIPMGLMSFFGTLQNIESASAAGDSFPAKPALLMNGIGTTVGAIFGSPFPTTVYIGHPGWKGLGARAGYSIINGAVMTLICVTGLMGVIVAAVPLEAGYPILLWIGVVITAQAFQATPAKHAPAVALGLMPAIASWGLSLLRQFVNRDGGLSGAEVDSMIADALPAHKGHTRFFGGRAVLGDVSHRGRRVPYRKGFSAVVRLDGTACRFFFLRPDSFIGNRPGDGGNGSARVCVLRSRHDSPVFFQQTQ